MNANAPQPRTLEVSLVWARGAMAMRTYTNVVLYLPSLWFIKMIRGSHAFLGPQYKNLYFQKSNPFMRLSPKCNCRWHDFSEALSATAEEPNELSLIAAGRKGIARRTPAVVINTTMSNGHCCVPCDRCSWGSLQKAAGQGEVCIFRDNSRDSPTKAVPSPQKPARCYP